MKHLILPVCFAATTAFATELKDPSAVARKWQQTVEQGRKPIGSAGNLVAQSDALTTTPLERIFSAEGSATLPLPPSRPKSLDAPSNKMPELNRNIRPKGSIPWEYNGEVYWLVPLNSPGDK